MAKYVGQWLANEMHGRGTLSYPDGRCVRVRVRGRVRGRGRGRVSPNPNPNPNLDGPEEGVQHPQSVDRLVGGEGVSAAASDAEAVYDAWLGVGYGYELGLHGVGVGVGAGVGVRVRVRVGLLAPRLG